MAHQHIDRDSEAWLMKAQPMPTAYCAVIHAQGKQVARINGREVAELEARADRFIRRGGFSDATYAVTAS
jgi:hypothetical protein